MSNVILTVKMVVIFVIFTTLATLCEGLELDLKSIGGLEADDDMEKDELYLEDFTQEEIKEYMKRKDISHLSLDDVLDPSESDLFRKAQKIDIETSLMYYFKLEKLEEDAEYKVKPLIRKANDLFYKIVDLDQTIGINQEFRDTIVDLVRQAQHNILVILEIWTEYKGPIRAKIFRSLDQLEQDLDEVRSEYESNVLNFEYGYGDYEKFYVDEAIERSESTIARHKKTEQQIHRMFNVFLKEERNLVKLGIKLWVNSQVDYDIRLENEMSNNALDKEAAELNEQRNQMQRKLITKINLNRAAIKNETSNIKATSKKGSDKQRSEL